MAVGEIQKDSKWQKLKEETICPICRRVFTDPKTTPCLHTFCKECLRESIEVSIQIFNSAPCCPLCREVLRRRNSNYPTDSRIKRLVEIFEQLEEKQQNKCKKLRKRKKNLEISKNVESVRGCGKCEEDLPVVNWCVECQVLLCHDCNEIHSKWKVFKLHTTVTIEEYPDFMVEQWSR